MSNNLKKYIAYLGPIVVFCLQRSIYEFVASMPYVKECPFLGIVFSLLIYAIVVLLTYFVVYIFNHLRYFIFDNSSIQTNLMSSYVELKKLIEEYNKNTIDTIELHKLINMIFFIISDISKILENVEKTKKYNYKSFTDKRIDIDLLLSIYDFCRDKWNDIFNKNEQKVEFKKIIELNNEIKLKFSVLDMVKQSRQKSS